MEALSSGEVVYPTDDGERLAENTAQYHWIEVLKGNLDALLPDDFVAADLLWYPIEGDNMTRMAPDVMVAQGRPKGGRGSYRQWQEGGTAPQFVVEVLSPGNTEAEMRDELAFYDNHGVLEYLVIDPDTDEPERALFEVHVRRSGRLPLASFEGSWKSKTLGISFAREGEHLLVRRPDGQPFLSAGRTG
jgi:Uma2 family endonuclease